LPVLADGISEKSLVYILLRFFISNLTRLWMVSPANWKQLAEATLEYLRSDWPVLVGGFVGSGMGDLSSLLKVR
jgi:hypothetical protein